MCFINVLNNNNSNHNNVTDCVSYLQLQPMCDDWEYLENQHLLLAVKTADGLESYGCFSAFFYTCTSVVVEINLNFRSGRSSSSSTNFIATQVLNKTSGPLYVTCYTTAVMSMLLWPIAISVIY